MGRVAANLIVLTEDTTLTTMAHENGVRSLALAWENYMFCGDNDSVERTAIIYSLL